MNHLAEQEEWKETGLAVSAETAELIEQGIAPSTMKRYRTLSLRLEAWLDGRVLTDGLLASYITELHATGKSPATISQVIAAVKWQAKNSGVEIAGPMTARTLDGIRRAGKERGTGQVDGVERDDMLRIVAFAESEKSIAGLRDAALIRLMSDCLLRISEAVAVDVSDLQKSTLTVRFSKTDQEGRGESLFVGDTTLKLIRRYRRKAGIEEGALFRRIRRGDHVTGERLTDVSARRIIKARAAAAGVEGFISGHSLRVGSAVSLAQAGASVVDMQNAGRWKSPQMPAHYAKAELAERGAVARYFYAKKGR